MNPITPQAVGLSAAGRIRLDDLYFHAVERLKHTPGTTDQRAAEAPTPCCPCRVGTRAKATAWASG